MYRLLIYCEDEVIHDYTIVKQKDAYEIGKFIVLALGEGYWYKVKVD